MSASFYLDNRPCVIGAGQDEHHFPTEDSPCACGRWRSHDAADATRILTRAVDVAMEWEWTKMYECGCRERGEEQIPCARHASRASHPDTFFNLERRKSSSPRVVARITKEDEPQYQARCEKCTVPVSDIAYLGTAAQYARIHALSTGHSVLVEAL